MAEKSEKKIIVVQSAADLQRLKLEKLMKNPTKEVYIPEKGKDPSAKKAPEFVRNVWGSSAGAGSGDFHVYRGVRRREYARQKFNTEKAKKDELDKEFKEKVTKIKETEESKAAKKRAKRLKKKQRQKEAKKRKKEGKTGESESEEEDDDDDDDNNDDNNENIDEVKDEIKDDAGEKEKSRRKIVGDNLVKTLDDEDNSTGPEEKEHNDSNTEINNIKDNNKQLLETANSVDS